MNPDLMPVSNFEHYFTEIGDISQCVDGMWTYWLFRDCAALIVLSRIYHELKEDSE